MRCTVEIEQTKEDKDRNFENVKSSLIDELSKDGDFFDSVQAGLLRYVDLYLGRQCLNKIREIKTLEMRTLVEYGDFLTEQMKLIGEEIDILEARKDKLVLQAKVDDVIELIGLSGCELAIGSNDDAPTLLVKVSELLDACDIDDRLTKFSLLRLRAVLQERVDFLPIIQYISWTIRQKKQLSRQLSSERRKINSDKDDKTNELNQVNESLDPLNRLVEEHAKTVRDCWAVPLTQLNVQISFMYAEQNRIFKELKVANEHIQKMKNEHSDDSWTWERLWRKKTDLKDQIPKVKAEIESLKSKRQQWYQRRQMVYTLCKRNNVYLISDNNSRESDEYRIINKRLTELYRIEEAKLAEQRFQEESARIQERKKEKVAEITVQIDRATEIQAEKYAIYIQASSQLSRGKRADARFFLSKLFSDTMKLAEQGRLYKLLKHKRKVQITICQN